MYVEHMLLKHITTYINYVDFIGAVMSLQFFN